jgi:hypothetical protein
MDEKEIKPTKAEKEPAAAELLAAAAAALEKQQGPRAPKHYRILAEQVRALIARI